MSGFCGSCGFGGFGGTTAFGSVVAANVATFVFLSVDIFHDALCILLRNLKVRHGGQQVDVAHIYVSSDVLVQELHQFARVETVLLAQVDEEFAEPLARRRCRLLASFALGTFVALLPFCRDRLYLRGIGIVG